MVLDVPEPIVLHACNPVGDTVVSVVRTPVHAPDHVALWHESSPTLFAGDLVIKGGSIVIEAGYGGNIKQCLRSLDRVLELGPRQLPPAHGCASTILLRSCGSISSVAISGSDQSSRRSMRDIVP